MAQISNLRQHHGCVTLKGKDGNPTVAISNKHVLLNFHIIPIFLYVFSVGSRNSNNPASPTATPEALAMELWDSVTLEKETVPHPDGLQTKALFRPTLVPFDDTSFLFLNAEVKEGSSPAEFLQNIYKYTYGSGWTLLSPNPSPLNTFAQTGVYLMKNPNLLNFDTLDFCSTRGELLFV